MAEDKKERAALIRKGNEHFNNGEFDRAIKIFLQTDYKDGLARVGDLYYYDRKEPLAAFNFYKKANMHNKVNEIFERMIYALGQWIGEDRVKDADGPSIQATPDNKENTIPVKVSPKLKILAEEILRDQEENNKS